MKFKAFFFLLIIGLFYGAIAQALTISPVRIEVTGNPGQELRGTMTLINEGKESTTLYSSFANFEAKGESGTPYFTTSGSGLSTWIKTENKVNLTSGEQKIIPYTVIIPKDATPGGYYSAIFWSETPPAKNASEQQVAISGRVGIIILLTVNGEIKFDGGLLGFSAKDNKNFFESVPVGFNFRFRNNGTDRVNPQGNLTIKNMFGFASAVMPVNKDGGNVLPNSVRKYNFSWGKDLPEKAPNGFFDLVKREWGDFHFGYYKADLSLKYSGDKTAFASYNLFILPWQLILLILIVITAIICISVMLVKKYNRWIIKMATNKK